mgnify:CR=1 FL=1
MNKIAVVDLSWIMHRYRHAHEELSCIIDGKRVPTGHIYGTYTFIKDLSSKYKRVVLAVDSNPTIRKEILSTYKSNRYKEIKDEFIDYRIHQDDDAVITLCTSFENVYYVKEEGYEADDIIGTLILKADKDWDFYFRDNDILQNIGTYNLCVSFEKDLTLGEVVDIREHIMRKYELDLDYLPLLWKVIKGDSGDCIPIGFERFPTKILKELCLDERLHSNYVSFDTCIDILTSYKNYTGKTKEAIEKLKDKNSDLCKKLEINYKLVKPMYLEKIKRQKMEGDISKIFSKFNIKNI